jgi:hypothetical protein
MNDGHALAIPVEDAARDCHRIGVAAPRRPAPPAKDGLVNRGGQGRIWIDRYPRAGRAQCDAGTGVTDAPETGFSNHDHSRSDASMRNPRVLGLALATLTLLACETPTSPPSQLLHVEADGSALTLKNPNDWPLFYIAANEGFLAASAKGVIADFALCTDPSSNCPRVAARATIRVPYAEIVGYYAGLPSVHITQWRVQRRSSGEYAAMDIRSLDAPLR